MTRSVPQQTGYIGRFAPSPTGPLHLGSLVAAVGGWLRARQMDGRWLLRIEDIDPPREPPGAADAILRTLERHGLWWDGEPLWQHDRHDAYAGALTRLVEAGHAYPCYCSRRQIADEGRRGPLGLIYTGHCRRHDDRRGTKPPAWRVVTDDEPIGFDDLRCGHHEQRLASALGDFVVKRADGYWAYQLAVVVDDAAQGVSEVVRGEDLLDNTPRQIHLQRLLGLPTPGYLHLPLVTNALGQKLSKQTFAKALDPARAGDNLIEALSHLGIHLPGTLRLAPPTEILATALAQVRHPTWRWSAPATALRF